MNIEFMKGVVVPIVTPIDEEERVDEALRRSKRNNAARACRFLAKVFRDHPDTNNKKQRTMF